MSFNISDGKGKIANTHSGFRFLDNDCLPPLEDVKTRIKMNKNQ